MINFLESKIKTSLMLLLLVSGTLLGNANSNVENVKIKSANGMLLDANYFSPGKPGPGILLLSMCDPTTDKSEWQIVASDLQKNGFHVITFDYQGFGNSEGTRPEMKGSLEEVMNSWRTGWMDDVKSVYDFLVNQKNVNQDLIGVGGASCGVFMGLEFALSHSNVKTLVSLGGPTDSTQLKKLNEKYNLPILIISANERSTLKWSDDLFSASKNEQTKITKYKIVTHGTKIFGFEPSIQKEIVEWFESKMINKN